MQNQKRCTIAMVEHVEISHRSLIVEDPSFKEEGQTGESRSSGARNPEGRPSSGPWYMFDDIPPYKQRERLQEFGAQIDLQMTQSSITLQQILIEFVSRMTENLREWFTKLSEYQKLQAVRAESQVAFLRAIHKEFLGDVNVIQ